MFSDYSSLERIHQRAELLEKQLSDAENDVNSELDASLRERIEALKAEAGVIKDDDRALDPLRVRLLKLEKDVAEVQAVLVAEHVEKLRKLKEFGAALKLADHRRDYEAIEQLADRRISEETAAQAKYDGTELPSSAWKTSREGRLLMGKGDYPGKEAFIQRYDEIQRQIQFLKEHGGEDRREELQLLEARATSLAINQLFYRHSRSTNPGEKADIEEKVREWIDEYKEHGVDSGHFRKLVLGSQGEKEWISPEAYAFRFECLRHGYQPKDSPLTRFGEKDFQVEITKELEAFVEWANEHPHQAQWMVGDILPLVAAIHDDKLTRKYGELLGSLAKGVREPPRGENITEETLRYLELSEATGQLWKLYQSGDEKAAGVIRQLGLEECPSELHFSKRAENPSNLNSRGVASFFQNLSFLKARQRPLMECQFERAIAKEESYVNSIVNTVKRDAVNAAKDVKRVTPKRSVWDFFSASRARAYLSQIWSSNNWAEKGLRIGAGVVSVGVGGVCLGGGIALIATGAGAAIGTALIGAVFAVPELFSSLNTIIDRFFVDEQRAQEEHKLLQVRGALLEELESRGAVSRFRPIKFSSLSRSDRKKAQDLYDRMKAELDEIAPLPGDLVHFSQEFERVLHKYDPLYYTLQESDEEWVHAAFNRLKESWYQPRLKKMVEAMTDWDADPSDNPDRLLRQRLEKVS